MSEQDAAARAAERIQGYLPDDFPAAEHELATFAAIIREEYAKDAPTVRKRSEVAAAGARAHESARRQVISGSLSLKCKECYQRWEQPFEVAPGEMLEADRCSVCGSNEVLIQFYSGQIEIDAPTSPQEMDSRAQGESVKLMAAATHGPISFDKALTAAPEWYIRFMRHGRDIPAE